MMDMESPITISARIWVETFKLWSLAKLANKYHDVNKNEVNIERMNLVTVRNGKNRKQLPVMTSSRNDFTPLLHWFEELNVELRTNQLAAITLGYQRENEVMQWLQSNTADFFKIIKESKMWKSKYHKNRKYNRSNKKLERYWYFFKKQY